MAKKKDKKAKSAKPAPKGSATKKASKPAAKKTAKKPAAKKTKKSRGRGRSKREGKKHYDSEDFVRKQIVKIDLTKPLIKKPKKIEPEPYVNNKDKRSRYSDKELTEFKEILLTKLQEAKVD